jgi:hypothetical protein
LLREDGEVFRGVGGIEFYDWIRIVLGLMNKGLFLNKKN